MLDTVFVFFRSVEALIKRPFNGICDQFVDLKKVLNKPNQRRTNGDPFLAGPASGPDAATSVVGNPAACIGDAAHRRSRREKDPPKKGKQTLLGESERDSPSTKTRREQKVPMYFSKFL